MALLDFFLSRKKNTANIAKERLQIIVAERRRGDAGAALPAAVAQRYSGSDL